ncbi:MAG: hypothetical protein WCP86_08020, partial [bacterium]
DWPSAMLADCLGLVLYSLFSKIITILSRKLRFPGPETPQRLLPVPQPRHSDTIDYGTAIALVQERTRILRATDHRHR